MTMKFFARSTGVKSGEMYIYQEIGDEDWGGISARTVRDELAKIKDVADLNIYINSPGGSVFEGFAIYNQIRRHNAKTKTVYVDGVAASIASVIMLAGDRRVVASNADIMIHDPWGFGFGNAAEMRKVADTLEKIRDNILDTYVDRTGYDRKQLSDMMAEETWFSASEAVKYGFANEVSESSSAQASFSMLAKFRNTPKKYAGASRATATRMAEMNMAANAIRNTRASSGK